MADSVEQRDRGFFHHKKPESDVVVETTEVYGTTTTVDGKPYDAKAEIKKHSTLEHVAEAGALLGGAVALFESHQAKKDPEHAHNHRIGEAVAGALAVGSGAFALHERHDKKDAEKEGKLHH